MGTQGDSNRLMILYLASKNISYIYINTQNMDEVDLFDDWILVPIDDFYDNDEESDD